MKTTPWIIAAFTLMVALQWFIPWRMIRHQEAVLREGRTFRFRCAPVDPADPFRGKYITLQFQSTSFNLDSDWMPTPGEPVFVSVRVDSSGYAIISEVTADTPLNTSDYFQATVQFINPETHQLSLEYPFNRFYLEEFKAPQAEKMYFESLQDSTRNLYALVTIHRGQSHLVDVHIDGVPITEAIQQN